MTNPQEDVSPTMATAVAQKPARRQSLLTPVTLCILATETAERFAYFGFRAILVLYFTYELSFSESQSIAYFAYVTSGAYLSPLAGALLADGRLGRYSTILWFGVVYVVGLSVLTVAAAMTKLDLELRRFLTFVGLFLVCMGTGGIKPCVSAFGADQVALSSTSAHTSERTTSIGKEEYCLVTMERESHAKKNGNGNKISSQHNANVDDQTSTGSIATAAAYDTAPEDYNHHREKLVRDFFAYFYFCINVGAVVSIALVPIVRNRFGFGAAFSLPTIFMVTAILLFLSKRKDYIHHKQGQDGASLSTTFRLCVWLVRRDPKWVAQHFPGLRKEEPSSGISSRSNSHHSLVPCEDENGLSQRRVGGEDIIKQQLDDAIQVVRVFPILAMLPIFWALYDQQGSVWTLQATRMGLSISKSFQIQPEQMTLINPILIMIFVPLFNRVIYPWMEARRWNIEPLRRMGWGMFLAAVSFFASGLVETSIQYREGHDLPKVNVFWQIPQLTILAVAEIFVSVTGLEFAYSSSPKRLKAFLMSIYLLTTAAGDLFSGFLYSTIFYNLDRATTMNVCACLMLGNLVLFCFVAKWWERREAHQHENWNGDAPAGELELEEKHQLV